MRNATSKSGAASASQTVSAPRGDDVPYFIDREVRTEVVEVLAPYSRSVLARAGNRTSEGAKEWKDLENGRCPNFTTALNLAVRLPRMRAYVLHKLGVEEGEFDSSRALAARLEAVERTLAAKTAEAPAVTRIMSGRSDAEARAARASFTVHDQPSNYTPDGALGDLLERRRG